MTTQPNISEEELDKVFREVPFMANETETYKERLKPIIRQAIKEAKQETIVEIIKWVVEEKSNLIMKWEDDKCRSWVYDKFLDKLNQLKKG